MAFNNLPKPFFVLAPMDDVTDTVFRQIVATLPDPLHLDGVQQSAESLDRAAGSVARQGNALRGSKPDLFFTEFVNVDGLQSPGREKIIHKLQFTDEETPLIAQLWGKNPENYYKSARDVVKMGFAGVDINMGCPAKPVVQNGCCSALINNRELAAEIITATQRGVTDELKAQGRGDEMGHFPVSVKTRLGFSQVDLSWPEFLLSHKLNMLTIHGRTVKEMSKVPAHWDLIGQVAKLRTSLAPNTLIVGNGDVENRAHGEELAKQYDLDGIMIGRGIFHDPYVFAEQSPWAEMSKAQKMDLYAKHVKLFAETWGDVGRRIVTLNKFCKVYIEGFPGAKELREELMSASTTDELLSKLGKS